MQFLWMMWRLRTFHTFDGQSVWYYLYILLNNLSPLCSLNWLVFCFRGHGCPLLAELDSTRCLEKLFIIAHVVWLLYLDWSLSHWFVLPPLRPAEHTSGSSHLCYYKRTSGKTLRFCSHRIQCVEACGTWHLKHKYKFLTCSILALNIASDNFNRAWTKQLDIRYISLNKGITDNTAWAFHSIRN